MAKIKFGRVRRSGRAAVAAAAVAAICGAMLATPALAAPAPTWATPVVTTDAPGTLVAVTCSSLAICVAVDSSGKVVTSTTPATGTSTSAWPTNSGAGLVTPTSVSCPQAAYCVAAVGGGKIAAAQNASGSTWTSTLVDSGHTVTAVSCPTSALCFAVDNHGSVLSSTSPTTGAWSPATAIDGTAMLNGLSCPTANFCAAVDATGKVLVSTTPTVGSSWQTTLSVVNPLTAISCTTTTACVAIDATDDAYASANAATPPVTWSTTPVDPTHTTDAVSCTDGGLCVIVDNAGNAITSDDVTAARPTWSVAAIDTGKQLNGISCVLAGLCVAVDASGQVVLGSSPLPTPTTGTGTASDQTDATLTATVDPGDAALSDCHFDFGNSTGYGSTVPCATIPTPGGGPQAVSVQVSGLTASTAYHFRIATATGVATQDGADASFTTPAPLKANPSLAGTPAVGSTLTCKPNVTTTAVETVAYQWLSDTVPIASANAATYVVAATDASHHLSCAVTIAGDGGSATATSGFDAVPASGGIKPTESVVGTAKDSRNGTVSAPVTCSPQAAGSCTFTLTLRTPGTVDHKRKAITIGSAKTTLSPGATKTLSVSLSASGRSLLARRRTLAVTFAVNGTLLGTLTAPLQTDKFTFTSTAARRKHAKRHGKTARHAPPGAR